MEVIVVRVVLLLTLYGIAFLALLPLVVKLLVNLERVLAASLGALPAAIAILALLGALVAVALYVWFQIARATVRRACKEPATTT